MHSTRMHPLWSRVRTGHALLLALVWLSTSVAHPSPLGTTYVATVSNLPGSATGPLAFDGLASAFGSSGLRVREKSTSFGAFELIEFALETANGDGFVGQQVDPMAPASVAVSGLRWSGGSEEPTSAKAEADSGFLWLSIDGEAQALSDVGGLGLRFGTHPLDASIPIVYIDNASTTQLGFDTFGETAFEAFTALVGPIRAAQIDGVHLGMAAAPVPEPGVGMMLVGGILGLVPLSRLRLRKCLRHAEIR